MQLVANRIDDQGVRIAGAVDASVIGEPIGKLHRWGMLVVLDFSIFLANFMAVCLFPHVVTLAVEYQQPISSVAWVMIVVTVVGTGASAVAAGLGAIFGNRMMLVVALGCILLGGMVAVLSEGFSTLVIGRGIQGIGLACQALAIGIITRHWAAADMRKALSSAVAATGAGTIAGYLMGGVIWKTGGDWRTEFWLMIGATALALLLTLTVVKETKRVRGARVDFVGAVGLLAWAVLIPLPLSQANTWGWGSARVCGLLVSGVVLLALWTIWELHNEAPLLDLRLLALAGVWQGAAAWFTIGTAFSVASISIPYLFETPSPPVGWGLGESALITSIALAVPGTVMVALSPTTPFLLRHLGSKRTIVLGAVFGLGEFGMALAHGSVWISVVWLSTVGVMAAWAGSASYAVAMEAVPARQGVIVSGLFIAVMNTGASAATAVAGYFLSLRVVTLNMTSPGSDQVMRASPADEAFTWSALLIGSIAALNLAVLAVGDLSESE